MTRRERKDQYLHCKIQANLKIALINKARKDNKSMGAVIREALRYYLKNQ